MKQQENSCLQAANAAGDCRRPASQIHDQTTIDSAVANSLNDLVTRQVSTVLDETLLAIARSVGAMANSLNDSATRQDSTVSEETLLVIARSNGAVANSLNDPRTRQNSTVSEETLLPLVPTHLAPLRITCKVMPNFSQEYADAVRAQKEHINKEVDSMSHAQMQAALAASQVDLDRYKAAGYQGFRCTAVSIKIGILKKKLQETREQKAQES